MQGLRPCLDSSNCAFEEAHDLHRLERRGYVGKDWPLQAGRSQPGVGARTRGQPPFASQVLRQLGQWLCARRGHHFHGLEGPNRKHPRAKATGTAGLAGSGRGQGRGRTAGPLRHRSSLDLEKSSPAERKKES